MKRVFYVLMSIVFSYLTISCKKFLDQKPDKKIVVPSSLNDIEALLNATTIFNNSAFGGILELGTNDYWLSDEAYNSISDFEKDNYLWKEKPIYQIADVASHWGTDYTVILYCNTILEEVVRVGGDTDDVSRLIGSALFFRSFAFFNLVQAYAPVYSEEFKNQLGIPLRLSSDINSPTTRSTLEETYKRILEDLNRSADLLPSSTAYPTQPTKAAANALLARVYLSMSNYELALLNAEKVKEHYDVIIDYNNINLKANITFSRFNIETIFYAHSRGAAALNSSRANISYELLGLYEEGDLRREAFFRERMPGVWMFKGGYHGQTNNTYFVGLATDEIYLIIAECHARIGNINSSLLALNTLLKHRYEKKIFKNFYTNDRGILLKKVLEERRKELLMRGLRWSDLKRLNLDPKFATVLKRIAPNGGFLESYSLPPNDKRYMFLIPQEIIELTNIMQNER